MVALVDRLEGGAEKRSEGRWLTAGVDRHAPRLHSRLTVAASPTPAPKTAIPSRNGADLLYADRVLKKRHFALIAGFALLGLPDGGARR